MWACNAFSGLSGSHSWALCVQAWGLVQNGSAPQAVSGTVTKPSQRYRGPARARRLEEAKQERSRRREEEGRATESTNLAVGHCSNTSSALGRSGIGQTWQQHHLHDLQLQVNLEEDKPSTVSGCPCSVQISMNRPAEIAEMREMVGLQQGSRDYQYMAPACICIVLLLS